MPGRREDWFPTSVWYFDHPDPAPLNAELLAHLRAEQARDAAGMPGKSNVLGWHSADDLHRRPPFAPLMAFVEECVREATAFARWDTARAGPQVTNCWAIVNGRGASNVVHTHPMCLLSGAYYVQAAPGCGKLFFQDPRPVASFVVAPVTGHTPWTYQKVTYEPTPGRLLLFPAWLPHGVEPNLSDGDRVVISFNVGLKWADPPA